MEWAVDCGTQDKGSKWIVFSLESYFLAGLLGVLYTHHESWVFLPKRV